MYGLRIVSARADPVLTQVVTQPVWVFGAHDEEVPDRVAALWHRRKDEITDARQPGEIGRRGYAPLAVPIVQVGQLREEDDRLESVEPRRPALPLVAVLRELSVLAQRPRHSGELGAIRRECP